jgi:hypothetical protein
MIPIDVFSSNMSDAKIKAWKLLLKMQVIATELINDPAMSATNPAYWIFVMTQMSLEQNIRRFHICEQPVFYAVVNEEPMFHIQIVSMWSTSLSVQLQLTQPELNWDGDVLDKYLYAAGTEHINKIGFKVPQVNLDKSRNAKLLITLDGQVYTANVELPMIS